MTTIRLKLRGIVECSRCYWYNEMLAKNNAKDNELEVLSLVLLGEEEKVCEGEEEQAYIVR